MDLSADQFAMLCFIKKSTAYTSVSNGEKIGAFIDFKCVCFDCHVRAASIGRSLRSSSTNQSQTSAAFEK